MQPGNISQTVWRRSILKQLKQGAVSSLPLKCLESEMCAAIPGDGEFFVAADATVCGNTHYTGIYAAIKALNDLMTRGAEPVALQVSLMLPVRIKETDVQKLISVLKEFCEENGVAIASVRAEVQAALRQTMVHVSAIGQAEEERLLRLEQADPEQDIILCGSIALEGMQRILDECEEELKERFVPAFLRQMKALKKELFVGEAIRSAWGHVSAMQQIGNGGIFAALWEVAEAAGLGLTVDLSQMTVCQETIEVCEFYRLNPYQMTSTGGVLMLTEDGESLLQILRGCGVRASRLGRTEKGKTRKIINGGESRFLDRPAPDELALWQEKRLMESEYKQL